MKTPPERIIVAVTGASGSVYARLLIARLLLQEGIREIGVIFSANGKAVADYEKQEFALDDPRIRVFDNGDMFSAPASGSARYDAMIVIPCSMGTVGRVAGGISCDLISRAADVMLKERRILILVPREAPLNTIHLRNLATLSECGAVVMPACPSFYSLPVDMEQLCMTVVERTVSLLGFDATNCWNGR